MDTQEKFDSLVGKTVRWKFFDGPTAGSTFEHSFHPDGSLTWQCTDGPGACAKTTTNRAAVVKLSDDVTVVSYLGAGGVTLTVALNLRDNRAVGFASNEKNWYEQTGTFEVM